MPERERGGASGAWPFVPAAYATSRLFYLVAGVLSVGVLSPDPIQLRSAGFAARHDEQLVLFLVFAAAMVAVAAQRLPLDLTLYAAALALTPAFFGTKTGPLMGLPRYLLAAVPLFAALGTLLQDRRLLAAWIAVSALFSLPLVALFVNWYFVA